MLVALVSLTSASTGKVEKEVKTEQSATLLKQCGGWSPMVGIQDDDGHGNCEEQFCSTRRCWEAVPVGYTLEIHYTTEWQCTPWTPCP